jgi:hypothetical protein
MQHMHRFLLASLFLVSLVGCGRKSDTQIPEGFARFASNVHLRLQHQYFEPRTAPAGVIIKLSDKPHAVLTGTHGAVVFTQAETTDTVDRDVRVTLTFERQNKRWELTTATAQIIAQAKRGQQKVPAAENPTDALADEVYGPRLRAAVAATPAE